MKRLMLLLLFCFNHAYSTENSELVFWQNIPKTELHLHLGGSYPKNYLLSIANEEQKQRLEQALLSVEKSIDYHEVFSVFQLVGQIITTDDKVQKGVEALCQSLKEDGVAYVEIRSGLKNLGNGIEAYLNAILNGIAKQNSEAFQARVLLSLQRNSPLPMVQETIDLAIKYRTYGVVGIDISGDSTIGQTTLILNELLRAKQAGLSFVVHMGESPKEKDQMELLTLLDPVRIGHGVHLVPEALNWIVSHQIPLEVCLTSSVLVQMVDRCEQHPGIQLFKNGHPIVFCTDDPLLFSTSLSRELLLAHKECGLSMEDVKKIANEAGHHKIPGPAF